MKDRMRWRTPVLVLAVLTAFLVMASVAGCSKSEQSADKAAKPVVEKAQRSAIDKTKAKDKAPVDPANAPKIEFAKTEVELGDVNQGDKAEHIFTFKNVGKGVLHIERAKGS